MSATCGYPMVFESIAVADVEAVVKPEVPVRHGIAGDLGSCAV